MRPGRPGAAALGPSGLALLGALACGGPGGGQATDGGTADGAGQAETQPDGAGGGSGQSACAKAAPGAPATIAIVPGGTRISGVGGSPNYQAVTADATVPAGCYARAVLRFSVKTECESKPPSGQNWPPGCDPFDRLAYLTLADEGAPTPLHLLHAVTPFGGAATWEQDVTDLAPALVGKHRYRAFVSSVATADGQASGSDAGFEVGVELVVTPGPPPREVVAVVPVFRQRIEPATAPLGAEVTAPPGQSPLRARLFFTTSGHGGKGNPPCDEFCKKQNTVSVDGMAVYDQAPWTDCPDTCTHVPASLSCGGKSWGYKCKENPTACPPSATYPRANWCPSKIVAPRVIDLPAAAARRTVGLAIAKVAGYFEVGLVAVLYR